MQVGGDFSYNVRIIFFFKINYIHQKKIVFLS